MTEREEPTEKQQNLRRNRANPRRQLSSRSGYSESKAVLGAGNFCQASSLRCALQRKGGIGYRS
jgi:hypothetical protein